MGRWKSNILAILLKHNTQVNRDRVEKQREASERLLEGAKNALKFIKKENDKK